MTILAVLAVLSILAVDARCTHLVTGVIGQPFAVKRPVPQSIRILADTNHRSVTVIAVTAICAVFSMVYHNHPPVAEGQPPADGLTPFLNLDAFPDITAVLNLTDNLTERIDRCIQLINAVR